MKCESISPPVAGFFSVVLLALAAGGCGKGGEAKGPQKGDGGTQVTLAEPTIKPVARTIEVVGTLYGDEDATISAKVAGRVGEIYKDVGDRVSAGEPLAQIDPTDYRLAQRQKALAVREVLARLGLNELPGETFDPTGVPTVRRSKLTADNAQAKYDRARQLHDQRPPLISDQDFADIQTAYSVAGSDLDVQLLTAQATANEARSKQADFDIATQTLSDTTLRAPLPVSGLASAAAPPTTNLAIPAESTTRPGDKPSAAVYAVSARLVSVGEYVSVGTPIFKVVRDDPVKLRAAVPERFSSQIRLEQPVVIRIDSYDRDFVATVSRINPQVDPVSRTFQVEAVAANPDRLLKPGAFARASVRTRIDPAVVFVPAGAVAAFAGTSKVFTVADGKAVEHVITTGRREGELVEITSGLDQPGPVVVEGVSRLASGLAVKTKDRKTPASTTAATTTHEK